MKFALFILVLLLSLNAEAVELRGDWESAGDQPMPYEPKYEFEYDCQLELKGELPYIAVTRFVFSNQKQYFETGKKTRWEWVKLGERGNEAPTPKNHGIQLEGHYAILTLWPGEGKSKDEVSLSLRGKMMWKGAEFSGKPYASRFTRSDERLQGEFFYSVTGPKKTANTIRGQLHCDKMK